MSIGKNYSQNCRGGSAKSRRSAIPLVGTTFALPLPNPAGAGGKGIGQKMRWMQIFGRRGAWVALVLVVLFSGVSTAHPRAAQSGVTVMTQNLFVGASLDPVLLASDPIELLFAVNSVWNEVQATDYPARAKKIADVIASQKPDLVGLQEVALWRIQSPGDLLVGGSVPATEVVYDFLETLLDELEARGQYYEVVVSLTGMDAELPSITGDDIRFTDRDVMLVRRERDGRGPVQILEVETGYFDTLLTLPVAGGGSIELTRGWSAADVRVRGREFRFVNTHLESVFAPVRQAQALELVAGPLNTSMPLICLGDFNTDADGDGSDGYNILIGAGLTDAWTDVFPNAPGPTWGQDADLLNPVSSLTERLDLILYQGHFHVHDIMVVGDLPADRTPSGLWPSDHAGVVAILR